MVNTIFCGNVLGIRYYSFLKVKPIKGRRQKKEKQRNFRLAVFPVLRLPFIVVMIARFVVPCNRGVADSPLCACYIDLHRLICAGCALGKPEGVGCFQQTREKLWKEEAFSVCGRWFRFLRGGMRASHPTDIWWGSNAWQRFCREHPHPEMWQGPAEAPTANSKITAGNHPSATFGDSSPQGEAITGHNLALAPFEGWFPK